MGTGYQQIERAVFLAACLIDLLLPPSQKGQVGLRAKQKQITKKKLYSPVADEIQKLIEQFVDRPGNQSNHKDIQKNDQQQLATAEIGAGHKNTSIFW